MSNIDKKINDITQLTRYKGKQLSSYVTEAIQETAQLQTALCWQKMPIIFFKYFILTIIMESKYFKNYFVTEAEFRLTVITVRNDLLRNVPPILPRNIGQIGQFELAQLLLGH